MDLADLQQTVLSKHHARRGFYLCPNLDDASTERRRRRYPDPKDSYARPTYASNEQEGTLGVSGTLTLCGVIFFRKKIFSPFCFTVFRVQSPFFPAKFRVRAVLAIIGAGRSAQSPVLHALHDLCA